MKPPDEEKEKGIGGTKGDRESKKSAQYENKTPDEIERMIKHLEEKRLIADMLEDEAEELADSNARNKWIKSSLHGLMPVVKPSERCPNSEILIEYAQGSIDEETARHIRVHLLFCDECTRELKALEDEEPF